MRVLANVRPTAEQLTVINDYRPGPLIIRGAAGSGKTTTAVLRLRHVVNVWRSAAIREHRPPVRVLVLSFNRTLRGYVQELVRRQVRSDHVALELDTFAGWARSLVERPTMAPAGARRSRLARLGNGLGLSADFLESEIDFVLGRYPANDLSGYLVPGTELYRRHGRGSPQLNEDRRRRLVDDVITPYQQWKADEGSSTGTTSRSLRLPLPERPTTSPWWTRRRTSPRT